MNAVAGGLSTVGSTEEMHRLKPTISRTQSTPDRPDGNPRTIALGTPFATHTLPWRPDLHFRGQHGHEANLCAELRSRV